MRYIIILIMLSACATRPRERAKQNVIQCTKDFMEYTKDMLDAYKVCDSIEKEY